MRALFKGNDAADPDGWTLISWNEVAEGTYVDPMQRYGYRYLNVLRQILSSSSSSRNDSTCTARSPSSSIAAPATG